ncbi:MAG TPA: amino acid permease [Candidatus Binatia bacterium]|nr:amino acid permease [Candidatus Binatia bacterium]
MANSLSNNRLGTFGGVFTPSLLTILGIILFRRLGYVVGNAGLGQALGIIGLSSAIAVLTTISLSAIATNIPVKGGGDYYLISRTLGVEFGAAIGIILFLAQSVSIAFYCMGFAEVAGSLWGTENRTDLQVIATVAATFLFVFAWLGADWATRLQYLIMSVLALAILSFFIGGFLRWEPALLVANWSHPHGSPEFWILFAIFFPAITGFTQGVSMSGELKDAGRSLPLGTFLALGLSILIYVGAAVVFAAALPSELLISDYGAMSRVSAIDWLIDAGVIAATLSSGMASFLGAPRILQSLAKDRTFPFLLPFSEGYGPSHNPRRAVLLSGAITVATVGLGSLNFIAPVVTMFFLISYALLNYATFYEGRAASPSFRPRFRFYAPRLSLVGAAACLGAMVAINLTASILAIAALFAVYYYVKHTAGPARWADSQRSFHFQRVRESLLSLGEDPEHPRDWRPCILAFCDDPARRERLLTFASWIEGESGITTAVELIEGEDEKAFQRRDKAEKEIREYIAKHKLEVFPRVIVTPDFRVGVETLIQSFGIGSIRANMVLLSRMDQLCEPEESQNQIRYGRELQQALRLRCNVVVLDAESDEWSRCESLPASELRIDVWWWGDRTSQLMLLLAYLMTRTDRWAEAKIRLLVPSSRAAAEKTVEQIRRTLEEVRIGAEPEVVLEVNEEVLAQHSADAALVFFPLRFRELGLLSPARGQIEMGKLLERLPIVALTVAGEDVDLDAEPDEGKAAEAAAALDAAADAEKLATKAEREALATAEQAEKKQRELESAKTAGEAAEAEAAVRDAQAIASRAAQESTDARAQAEAAALAAAKLGVKPTASEK